jgi:hypothetical protein
MNRRQLAFTRERITLLPLYRLCSQAELAQESRQCSAAATFVAYLHCKNDVSSNISLPFYYVQPPLAKG